jgi:hypothetical protein
MDFLRIFQVHRRRNAPSLCACRQDGANSVPSAFPMQLEQIVEKCPCRHRKQLLVEMHDIPRLL